MKDQRNYRRRLFQNQSTRRALLRGATLSGAGLVAAAVIGCRKEETQLAVITPEGQPQYGGVFRYNSHATNAPYDRGLDPHVQPGSKTGRMRLFYQTLVRANPRTWEVEPELAQRWEQPSPIELVFTLASGVKFQNKPPANGRAMTAEDVVFSLERVRTPEPRFISRSLLESVDKIEAVDRSRVRLTLKLADTTVLDKLTGFPEVVLAPEVVERAGDKFTTPEVAVGTGPFILTELNDTQAVLVRNPEYWKPGLPYLDQVLIPAFSDDEARWAAFLTGKFDLENEVLGTVAKKYSTQQGRFVIEGRFPAEWSANPSGSWIFMNVRRTPFNDPRVYRALRLLINHQEAITADTELERGRGGFSQAFGSALAQWDFSQEEYVTRFLEWKQPKDEAARTAVNLLTAAGFSRERPVAVAISSLSSTGFRVRSELLQAQWRQLSQGIVQAELKLFDGGVFDQITARRDYDVLIRGAAPPAAEVDGYLRGNYYTNASRNFAQWSDPRADEMIDRQRETFDVQQRKVLVKEILVYLIENAPTVVWANYYTLTAANPKLRGWVPENDSWAFGFQYENVWLEG